MQFEKNIAILSGLTLSQPRNRVYCPNIVFQTTKIDPPPDLAIEIDVTSRTHPSIYENLGVGELWRFQKGKLQIYVLENNKYIESKFSPHFPDLPLTEIIPEYRDRCQILGRNQTMRAFRNWIREQS